MDTLMSAPYHVNMLDVKSGRDDGLRESIELLYFGYRAFTAGPDGILSRQALGRVHHRILYFVGRNPNIAVHSLLETLAVSKQALHTPLRHLVERNLVSIKSNAEDRRFRHLALTAEGRKLEEQLTGTQLKHLGRVFASAGPKSEESWKTIMRSLADGAP
jgi:DNA-binding MarR family transcriptional regulator